MKKYIYLSVGLFLFLIGYLVYVSTQTFDQSKHPLFEYREFDGFVLEDVYWQFSEGPKSESDLYFYNIHGKITSMTDVVIEQVDLLCFIEASKDKYTGIKISSEIVKLEPHMSIDVSFNIGYSKPGGLYKIFGGPTYEINKIHVQNVYIFNGNVKLNRLFRDERNNDEIIIEYERQFQEFNRN